VEFPDGDDYREYEGCIVECAWDGEEGVWRFMRTRSDKLTPNAFHVYEKVILFPHSFKRRNTGKCRH
jgi:hypothetical protein